MGKVLGKGNIREKKSNFSDTLYAKSWKSLLHSERLKNLIKEFGYRVIFFPHINISPYIDEFEIPEDIELLTTQMALFRIYLREPPLWLRTIICSF